MKSLIRSKINQGGCNNIPPLYILYILVSSIVISLVVSIIMIVIILRR